MLSLCSVQPVVHNESGETLGWMQLAVVLMKKEGGGSPLTIKKAMLGNKGQKTSPMVAAIRGIGRD